MHSEEIKQTNIYNYFTKNNKRTSTNLRTLDDKYNNELLKKQISKKEKSEAFNTTNNNTSNKNGNLKIKDFFTFKEFPEEIFEIQKDLKNMHILSDSNNNKTGAVDASEFNRAKIISEFNPFIDEQQPRSSSSKNENLNLNLSLSNKSENNINNALTLTTSFNITNNANNSSSFSSNFHSIHANNANISTNNFSNLHNVNTQAKDKRQNYDISKYFPILESREELRLFRQNIDKNSNSSHNSNSNIYSKILNDGIHNSQSNFNGEIEKVFILDHFSNKAENVIESANKLNIELSHSLENSGNSILKSSLVSTNANYESSMNNENNNSNNNNFKNKNCEDVEMEILISNNNNNNNFNNSEKITTTAANKNLPKSNNPYNPFILNVNSKNKYQDTKITKYIHIQDPPNMKLNRELLVNVLEFIDLRHLIRKVPVICKFWNDLYNKTISSPTYNTKLDFTDTTKINEKEIHILFKKGKNLKHVKLLKEIIAEDFGGNKGVENFFKKIALIMTLAEPKQIDHKGIMLSSFKLRPRRANEMNNFISTKSVNMICEASKYSLRTLVLRNCSKLTNKVFDGISSCIFLTTLEVSFNE